ncbi:MAG: WecB/TagA/CpsF family glycosyltransferase [Planctomycetia bacterium]|jgi:N-acetylglucosaminyldiphosphoundecaprenol N-acetyl-beta-D-mannosaminyltransferase
MKSQHNTKNRQSTENRFNPNSPETVEVLGLPIARVTQGQMLEMIDHLIAEKRPNFFITANLHYAKLCDQQPELAEVNQKAAFLVADGMPLVWSSWLKRNKKLPERITGADGIFQISQRAAERGYRLFLLGAAPEIAVRAAESLRNRYPGLNIVGIETPMLSELDEAEMAKLLKKIRDASPDILFAALGQPKGEIWLSKHIEELGVPVCVQIGASLDFAAGKVSRAPHWMQRTGIEWLYRLSQEPKRLFHRYSTDAVFFLRSLFGLKKSQKSV